MVQCLIWLLSLHVHSCDSCFCKSSFSSVLAHRTKESKNTVVSSGMGFITASCCQKLHISAMLALNEMHGQGASLFQRSCICDFVSPCNAIIIIQNCAVFHAVLLPDGDTGVAVLGCRLGLRCMMALNCSAKTTGSPSQEKQGTTGTPQ